MKATIIGSQPLLSIPRWEKKNSFGLNRAAIDYQTEFAFTGHEEWIQKYRELRMKNVIAIDPLFENIHVEAIDYIKYDMGEARNPEMGVEYCREWVQRAIRKEDIGYHNRLSILHMAMFYVIKKGFKQIDIIGCANNYDKINGYNAHQISAAPIMREFTANMVEASRLCGVHFNWIQSPSGELPAPIQPKPVNLNILSIDGYFKRHFDLCRTHKTQQDAYDELEAEYFALTKRNKYSSFDSFRKAKSIFYSNKFNR